jgi:hypothetical protein
MLVFDVLDDGVPAKHLISLNLEYCLFVMQTVPSIVIDLISVTGGIDNVESQTHTVFFDDYKNTTFEYSEQHVDNRVIDIL